MIKTFVKLNVINKNFEDRTSLTIQILWLDHNLSLLKRHKHISKNKKYIFQHYIQLKTSRPKMYKENMSKSLNIFVKKFRKTFLYFSFTDTKIS